MPSQNSKPGHISVRGARQHNLKNLDLDLPLGELIVITGPSGSGKTSLAFHTLYAEGQRRYVETFSPYVRQFFDRMDKPLVDKIDGIPPAIAIEQKNTIRTTRSTVGTLTEINDYLKLLYPRLATATHPITGEEIKPDTPASIAVWAKKNHLDENILILFPVNIPEKTTPADLFPLLNSQGYLRVLLNDEIHRTDEVPENSALEIQSEILVVQDRLKISTSNNTRLHEAIETALRLGKGNCGVTVAEALSLCDTPQTKSQKNLKFRTPHSFNATWSPLRAPTSSLFSFNNPLGACPTCRGFGRVIGIDLKKAIPNHLLSLKKGAIKPFEGDRGSECLRDLLKHCPEAGIDPKTPWHELTPEQQRWVKFGERKKHRNADTLSASQTSDQLWEEGKWYGIKGFFDWLETKAYKMHVRVFLARYRAYTECPDCEGSRLQPDALCFRIDGKTLPELWQLPIEDLAAWFTSLEKNPVTSQKIKTDQSLKLVFTEIGHRLDYLLQVGLSYLTLDRPARTLSGGEIARVNLTTCLGSALTHTLFVLDEPTVGLHPRDIDRLTGIMHALRDKGNTLLVVEHDEAVMRQADRLIDIGPAAGEHGGNITYQGPVAEALSLCGPCAKKGEAAPEGGIGVPPVSEESNTNKVPIKGEAEKTRSIGVSPVSTTSARRITHSPASKNPTTKSQIISESQTQNAEFPSLTLAYLSGQKSIPTPKTRRKPTSFLKIRQATCHNLNNLSLDLPLGIFTCLTGVSGSGKSTLAHPVIYRHLARHFGLNLDEEPAAAELTGLEKISGIELIDQTPLARTPRSTPAVLLGAFTHIRELFSLLPEAQEKNLGPGYFSFNAGKGRCERCGGNGFEKVEMQFLSDLFLTCPACEGKRYSDPALEYRYKNKNIAEILQLTATESLNFFANDDSVAVALSLCESSPKSARGVTVPVTMPNKNEAEAKKSSKDTSKPTPSEKKETLLRTKIHKALAPLIDTGLGYLRLGQALNTLSGGESQRLKLCQLLGKVDSTTKIESFPIHYLNDASAVTEYLAKNKKAALNKTTAKDKTKAVAIAPSTLLILDEPTTGLHFSDIEKLLTVFHRLVDNGYSLLVIEHHTDVIKNADHVIDLGPEAGQHGGRIVSQGTPEQVAKTKTHTGKALKAALKNEKSKNPKTKSEQATGSKNRSAEPQLGESPLKELGRPACDNNPETKSPNQDLVSSSLASASLPSSISLKGVRHHNLKNISLDIPHHKFVVISGLSGSGKSTLSFDVIFAEGQRRFLDSMSPYARQFASQLEKPDLDLITGLPPTVAIEQRISRGGGKSTVGTVTEIYQFLRLLFAKVGTQHCPQSGLPVVSQTTDDITRQIQQLLKKEEKILLLAPVLTNRKGFHKEFAEAATRHGFPALLIDGEIVLTADFQPLARHKTHDIDFIIAELTQKTPVAEIRTHLETALQHGKGTVRLLPTPTKAQKTKSALRIPNSALVTASTARVSPTTGKSFEALDPHHFSFNSPRGWCPTCRGYGTVPAGRKKQLLTEKFNSTAEAELYEEKHRDSADEEHVPCPDCHGARLRENSRHVYIEGGSPKTRSVGVPPALATQVPKKGEALPEGSIGVPPVSEESSPTSARSKSNSPTTKNPVTKSQNPQSISLPHLTSLSVQNARLLLSTFQFTGREKIIARDILPEITQRLQFLEKVGLGYLQLDRSATTLSGGESQRIRLAAQLGSNLQGVLYILDEPTIGLHPRDNAALLETLDALLEKGNSLLIVEHDDDTIRHADHLIDLGPGAGRLGGQITFEGNVAEALSLCEPSQHKVEGGPPPSTTPVPKKSEAVPEGGIGVSPVSEESNTTQVPKKDEAATRSTGRCAPWVVPPVATSPTTQSQIKNLKSDNLKSESLTSTTLNALAHPLKHPSRPRRKLPKLNEKSAWLTLKGCHANNLKNIDVNLPLERLTVLTGVSGSGKSSLMRGCIAIAAANSRTKNSALRTPHSAFSSTSGFKTIKHCFEVDQTPIGKTSRSCPATYVKLFDEIRKVFSQLPEARIRGYTASRFSFNNKEGQCPECKGNGRLKLEMDFLPTTWIDCDSCHGDRYNPPTLEIRYKGLHIGDVLRLSIADAAAFFSAYTKLSKTLSLLNDTGLGYLTLGQPSPTLSGGEAQRLKLVSELTKGRAKIALTKAYHSNLYLIEEPSIGLHQQDVARLIDVLHRLVDEGHTVIVIEHHMDIAAEADYLIDMGPEAGEGGGKIVARGTPEQVVKSKTSVTAPFLKAVLRSAEPQLGEKK